MSWQLLAFILLGLGLAAGFAWYERTRPDAKTVALVGTLAAFAALGRIAFAPLPNVKPTTDIVLIAGYTLGGAPGYVVGALAGLTSNFFFGQGPWTPWQMAAWGLTGILGAVLAATSGNRIGRRTMAVLCFVIGFGFTAMQDLGDWVTYSDHSISQLGVYVGKGLGFDLIHALGCAGFALAFGPGLVRALIRFRRRMTVSWAVDAGRFGAPLLLVVLLAGSLLTATSARAGSAAPGQPIQYLLSAQNHDGGFGNAPGQPSNPMVSGWAMLALAAGKQAPRSTAHGPGAANAAQYLSRTVRQDLGDPGSIERTILAATAAGQSPRDVGGIDLVARLMREIHGNGSVADQTNLTAFGVLALRAAGLTPPTTMVAWLLRQQDSDGGFNFATAGATSDVDDTAAVVEALSQAQRSGAATGGGHVLTAESERSAITRAVTFIRSQQNHDGGFPSQGGAPSNAQSTAFAIQGLVAAGISPALVHGPSGATPEDYLKSLIAPSGAVSYAKGNDQTPVWVTAEAELALTGNPLPVHSPVGVSPSATDTVTRPSVPATKANPLPTSATKHRSSAVQSAHAKRRPSPGARSVRPDSKGVSRVMSWIGALEGVALGLART